MIIADKCSEEEEMSPDKGASCRALSTREMRRNAARSDVRIVIRDSEALIIVTSTIAD